MENNKLKFTEPVSSTNERLFQAVNRLPVTLHSVVSEFETPTEKQMALYAVTGLTSALMPHVWVNYADAKNYMPVMVLISFPPVSGKGKLALLVNLIRGIVKEQMEENRQLKARYNRQVKLFEKSLKSDTPLEMPDKPPYRLLLVPGNITSAKLTEQLSENDGDMVLLIFESEIDALSNMM